VLPEPATKIFEGMNSRK